MMIDPIKHMVNRFLSWKLPEDFNPDGGVSFKRDFNENTPYPMKHEPMGTNLLNAAQAEEMVRYMVEGLPDKVGVWLNATADAKLECEKLRAELAARDALLRELRVDMNNLGVWSPLLARINALKKGDDNGAA